MALLPQDRQSQVMRRLVPEKNEVPALIDDISTKAKVRGVTIGRIEPQAVEPGQPFDTYRYRLEIIGHYDQLGEFLSDIASLPRIIVPQDVLLKPAQQQAQKLLGDTLGSSYASPCCSRRARSPRRPSPARSRPGGTASGPTRCERRTARRGRRCWCARCSPTRAAGGIRSCRCSARATSGRCCRTCGWWASTTTAATRRAASRCCGTSRTTRSTG